MSHTQLDIAAKHAAAAASSTMAAFPEGWSMQGDLADLAANKESKESQELVLYTNTSISEKSKKESEDTLEPIHKPLIG